MARIRHTGIYVDDLNLMKEFYSRLLKAEDISYSIEEGSYIDKVLGLDNAKIEIYKIKADRGGIIELLKYLSAPGGKRGQAQNIWETGHMHIAVEVASVDRIFQEFIAKGMTFLSEPCRSPDGHAKVCFLRDPEGNYLELVELL